MDKIRQWYISNYSQITWFLIGFLVMAGLQDASRGDWTGAVFSWGIALVNYIFVRR